MRHWAVLLVGVVILVGATGPGVRAEHGQAIRLNGTVTATNGSPAGDAIVFVGDDSTLSQFSTSELRDLADSNPRNLSVVSVAADGEFNTSIGSHRAQAAVAINPNGISRLKYIRNSTETLRFRLYDRRPQLIHEHLGAVAHDERRADLFINLQHTGDRPIQNLSVRLISIPTGWQIANVTTDGEYHSGNRTLRWRAVSPGREIDTTVELSVPEGTAPGDYSVGLQARSDTHRVRAATETVEVLPEETAGPTTSPPPVDDGNQPTPAARTTAPAAPMTTDKDTPASTSMTGTGFGFLSAGAALLILVSVFDARRDI